MSKRLLKVGLPLVAILLGATGLFFALSRPPQQWRLPQVAAKFLGTTNDDSGMRFGRFMVRNTDDRALSVSLPGFVDFGMRGGGYFGLTNAMLRPGDSVETWIEAPTNLPHWRAEFLCGVPLNWPQQTKNLAHKLGAPVVPYGQTSHSSYSDWVTNPPDWTRRAGFTTNTGLKTDDRGR